jgi:PEP-CTERM motif
MNRAWKPIARTAAALAVAAWGHAAQAQSNTVTYFFSGNCSSCATEAGRTSFPVMARLTLQDYEPGSAIEADHVQSLWYTGSNLVDMFTLTGPTATLTPGRQFSVAGIDATSGQLGPIAGLPLAFSVGFDDGLFFRTQADGSFSVCSPRGNAFFGGDTCQLSGADVGTGRWMITAVPEPSAALMLAGGIAALALLRRRRAG